MSPGEGAFFFRSCRTTTSALTALPAALPRRRKHGATARVARGEQGEPSTATTCKSILLPDATTIQVVSVAKGGEEITVRELTQVEKDARAAKHVAALKALGHPIDAVEGSLAKLGKSISKESGDYFSPAGPGKGKGKATSDRKSVV